MIIMHDELYQHLFLKNGTVYYLFFYNIANAIGIMVFLTEDRLVFLTKVWINLLIILNAFNNQKLIKQNGAFKKEMKL